MAFANYLGQGTYSVIDDIMWNKKNKSIRFLLEIYSDSSKTALLATKQFDYYFINTFNVLKSTTMSDPPANPVEGDAYFVPVGTPATGLFAGHEGEIGIWKNDMSDYEWWYYTPGEVYYSDIEDQYYVIDEAFQAQTRSWAPDILTWDKWFSADKVLLDENSNMAKQIYLFLKGNIEGFENVVDA